MMKGGKWSEGSIGRTETRERAHDGRQAPKKKKGREERKNIYYTFLFAHYLVSELKER